jgi:diaminohydroxyphosphoribosylaminopyrimidine deaminase/5-amino-6-(5-phosphoribosylamino)uracil reductase
VHVGLCAEQGHALLAPFQVCRTQGRAYVHAKWAMTLDGKLATRTGHSQWISNAESRQRVHALRGRMDAILVGIGTVLQDDPLLTARPAGGRVPCRVVLDSQARLPVSSQLVQTARETPVLLIVGAQADPARIAPLQTAGVEVLALPSPTVEMQPGGVDLLAVLKELAARGGTNVLIEGGSGVLGSAWDAGLIDEVHCFVSPKLAGGRQACSPIAGLGQERIPEQASLMTPQIEVLGDNVYFHGQVRRND